MEFDDTIGLSYPVCRGGRLCPPSKFVDFSWLFVGADAHIGPSGCETGAAAIFRWTRAVFHTPRRGGRLCPPAGKRPFLWKTDAKSQHFQWADVGIGPYKRPRKFNEFRGRTEPPAPTNGIR